jgi:hypothetical protein
VTVTSPHQSANPSVAPIVGNIRSCQHLILIINVRETQLLASSLTCGPRGAGADRAAGGGRHTRVGAGRCTLRKQGERPRWSAYHTRVRAGEALHLRADGGNVHIGAHERLQPLSARAQVRRALHARSRGGWLVTIAPLAHAGRPTKRSGWRSGVWSRTSTPQSPR